jgi:hypothetical protein
MGTCAHPRLDLQTVAAHDAAGRVQEIDVTGTALRVEGALDRQRSHLTFVDQDGATGSLGESQLDAGLPAGRLDL